jgi:hypothetical protein
MSVKQIATVHSIGAGSDSVSVHSFATLATRGDKITREHLLSTLQLLEVIRFLELQFQASEQRNEIDRLADEIIGAGVERAEQYLRIVLTGKADDGRVLVISRAVMLRQSSMPTTAANLDVHEERAELLILGEFLGDGESFVVVARYNDAVIFDVPETPSVPLALKDRRQQSRSCIGP